ncbi:MAG: sensor histidine kinase [Chthoniobacterales bacterium]
MPALAPTGERDLDRVVGALNRLNARLKKTREELARSDRLIAIGRMASELTHEIGNPLAAMRLRTENALAATPERAPEALKIILSQIGRLEELLNALRLLTNSAEVRPQLVALVPFLRARLEAIAPAAEEAGVALTLEPEPAAEVVWSFDEKSLGRALDNLLLNAVQHTPRGGVVRLGALVSESGCRCLVADDGPGVSLGEAEKIFEPFVTHRAEGVGLGLALVREIAQAHGGSARLETKAVGARGATFVLELPRWQKS